MTDRLSLSQSFLNHSGWGDAERRPLAGDASFRRYERLHRGGETAVLMDAPPPQEDVRPFTRMARWLAQQGFSAPQILAEDAAQGFLLLEDLGDDLYARLLRHAGNDEHTLYAAAIDCLLELHKLAAPADLAPYDVPRLVDEAGLFPDWYLPALTGQPTPPAQRAAFDALLAELAPAAIMPQPIAVLRDFHAENLLWLPGRQGSARVGLLDFQDAVAGHPAYDLVSLLEDARRDVAPALAEAMLNRYIAGSGLDEASFRRAYAILGAQRNIRIIGIFTRLWKRDGKPGYQAFMPRMWGLLERDLAHPDLAALRAWIDAAVPADLRRQPLPGLEYAA